MPSNSREPDPRSREPERRSREPERRRPAPAQGRPDQPWRAEGVPPAKKKDDRPDGTRGRGFKPSRNTYFWLLLILVFALSFVSMNLTGRQETSTIAYTEFTKQVQAGNVKDVYTKGFQIQGELKTAQVVPGQGDQDKKYSSFETLRPEFADDKIYSDMVAKGVVVEAKPINEDRGFLANLLLSLLPTLLFVGLFVAAMIYVQRRVAGGGGAGGMLRGFGRSPKPVTPDEKRATFADVAGIDEVEDELSDVVDFLKHPDKYRRLGARAPRGVLLTGAPGTGKTLLARAVAGEADVPFYSAAASEFIEMVVGVGAARVRELFTEARKTAPSIIFIDEIDTIGRARGGGASMGGHDEREQTLNQILTEMDGFSGSEGVVVIAATNRPDILDPALLRPGRFDRQVAVAPPDLEGRVAILKVHTRDVPLAPEVDLAAIAKMTPGMTGADLANLVNEAALGAVKADKAAVDMADVNAALEKIQLGTRRSLVMAPDERRRTSYHESGHALLGMLFPGADPVRKITIVPHGRALGVTVSTPDSDRYAYDRNYLRGRIIGALGGMAAEELVFGVITTGAESDLEQVTKIARGMVGRWGMSERIGPLSVLPPEGGDPYGQYAAQGTLDALDEEVRRIVDDCYAEALRTLRENRDKLESLAAALLEHETLDETGVYAAAGIPRLAKGAGDA
ncbi:ATP-dependent zinc metalloprotease FtsH [Actinomadura parmotrematis]|uniref:ATP-dependent zinc metalloprotease FtsH n=1 Tax=Actinomadura parmotrematis TaxID=2864039 RepID=A0ABS7FTK5_9ACTN|nr:ATP-dependent zinc metalloprotease FtsH [Actinomadura parmotrematis]MBW8483646.1 ATP-dependent zinc metalloprotease FtsH [Actinomadura parmotrematis]